MPSRSPVPPVEHPKRAEGVPTAWFADLSLEVEVHPAGVDPVEQPAPVGLAFGPHDLDRLGHTRIRFGPSAAEVVEGAQHVVAPVVREGEVEVLRIDDIAGALPAEQTALEEVLLAAPACLVHGWRAAGGSLELQQSVEHVD